MTFFAAVFCHVKGIRTGGLAGPGLVSHRDAHGNVVMFTCLGQGTRRLPVHTERFTYMAEGRRLLGVHLLLMTKD